MNRSILGHRRHRHRRRCDQQQRKPPCTVLFIGGTDWAALGRRATEGDVLCPKRLLSFPKKIKLVASGPVACHSVCIDVDGGVSFLFERDTAV